MAGFLVRPEQLPPGLEDRDLESLVEEVHGKCSGSSKQQACR